MWRSNRYGHPANIWNGHFASYADALKHYESVKPIRKTEIRPIGGNRRHKHCEIRKRDDGAIECVLYRAPCVTIEANGNVTLSYANWPTPTTAKFIDAVLPPKFGQVSLQKGRVVWSIKRGEEWEYYEIPREGLVLKASDDWSTLMPVGTPTQYNYVANRKVLKQLRDTYRGFIDYLKVTSALSDMITSDEIIDHFPNVGAAFVADYMENISRAYTWHFPLDWVMRRVVFAEVRSIVTTMLPDSPDKIEELSNNFNQALAWAASDDPMQWRKLTIRLAMRNYMSEALHLRDKRSTYDLLQTFVGAEYKETPVIAFQTEGHRLQEAFDEVLKIAYADVCFTSKEVKVGTLPSSTNKLYVSTYHQIKDNLTSRQYVRI